MIPLVGASKSPIMLEQCRFSTTGRSHDTEKFSLFNFEVHIFQCHGFNLIRTINLVYLSQFNHNGKYLIVIDLFSSQFIDSSQLSVKWYAKANIHSLSIIYIYKQLFGNEHSVRFQLSASLFYSSLKASAGNIFAARVTGAYVPSNAIISNTIYASTLTIRKCVSGWFCQYTGLPFSDGLAKPDT